MLPTQADLEGLLDKLRREQTESSLVDAKEDLPLTKQGDKATFIRHVAALANNANPSFLLLGVQDKIWRIVGLPASSELRDADCTQSRMNQILENKLDPNLSIRYSTCSISGLVVGVVAVEGTRAPYITAISDQSWGGESTKAEPAFIYRGAIYVRHGSSSEIANRQSDLIPILRAGPIAHLLTTEPDPFLSKSNYLDVESDDFGKHALTEALVEHPRRDAFARAEEEPISARSWVSFVFVPESATCTIDTVALKTKLEPTNRIGRGPNWFEGLPEDLLQALFRANATPRQYLATSPASNPEEPVRYERFVRICPSGHLEIAATYPLFFQRGGVRCLGFVAIIGYLWQLLYLTKALYQDAGYTGSTRVLLNLIGTRGTILADFADSRGGWMSPFDAMYHLEARDREWSTDANIQIACDVTLPEASDGTMEEAVRAIAQDLGAYYGQDRPRCFDYKTGTFPWRQYVEAHCWH